MSTPKEQQKHQVQIQIRVDDDIAQGVYANMAMVNHSDAEFTIDFVYIQPQAPQAKVRARVITSPRHLKRLVAALQENLSRYETRYGTVDMGVAPPEGAFRH
jgi:hypothetical protein